MHKLSLTYDLMQKNDTAKFYTTFVNHLISKDHAKRVLVILSKALERSLPLAKGYKNS